MVEPGTARIRLKVHQQLVRMHPADLADILEDLGRVERREIVTALDPETAAQALSEADPSVQAAVVEGIVTAVRVLAALDWAAWMSFVLG